MVIKSTGLIKGGSLWLASAFLLLSSQSLLAASAPASYIAALTVNGDVISFTTDSAKTHTLPACVSGTSEEQWAISYAGNAPLYALLSIAQSANEPIEITSANDCGAASGIERASYVNIHYQRSEQTPAVVASNTNFVARSTLEVPEGVEPGSVVVQFQLTGPGSSAAWQTASVVDNAYTFNFGQLAQGNYTLVTKAGSGETEVQDSISFSAITMSTSSVYVDNATGDLYLQLPDNTYLKLTQDNGLWTVEVLTQWPTIALSPTNFTYAEIEANGDNLIDIRITDSGTLEVIELLQNAAGYDVTNLDITPVIVTYQYDALGRLKEVTDPKNGNRNYTYDKAGNRITAGNTGAGN